MSLRRESKIAHLRIEYPLDLRLAPREVCVITVDIVVRAGKAELTGVESAIVFWKLTAGTWFALSGQISNRVPRPISWRSPHPPVGVASLLVPDEIADANIFCSFPLSPGWSSPLVTLFRSGVPLKGPNLLKSDPTPNETAPRPTRSLFSSDGP